jgi:hypothetical protein
MRMAKLESVEATLLEIVTGASAWDYVDRAAGYIDKGWKDKSCPSRWSYVGWGVGTLQGLGQAAVVAGAATKFKEPVKAAVWLTSLISPVNGLGGAALSSNYLDNCEAKKKAGK